MSYRISFSILILSLFVMGCDQKASVTSDQQPVSSSSSVISAKGEEVSIVTTASNTELRLTESGTASFEPGTQPIEPEVSIFVNPNHTFQKFMGIGGAITDASAEIFAKLPEAKQQELLIAYYDLEEGIGYSLTRTTIHSCDFSSGSYTYIEEGDNELTSFSIDHDQAYRIPMIKRAIEAAGGELLLYASPSGALPFRMNPWGFSDGNLVFTPPKKNEIFSKII